MRHGNVGHIINSNGYNTNYLLNNITSTPSVTITNPTAYWKFEESSGTRFDTVTSPSACDLNSLQGSITQTTGKIGNGALMQGNPSNIARSTSAPAKVSVSGNVAWSVALWISLQSPLTGQAVYYCGSGNFSISVGTSQLSVTSYSGDKTSWSTQIPFTPVVNTWIYVAFRTTGSQMSLSVNGSAFSGTTAALNPYGTTSVEFGRFNANRIVDEAGLWIGTALSDIEINALYNNGNGKTYNGTAWI